MDYTTILQKAESFVRALFEKNESKNLLFHNLEHTEDVVARAKEIASQYDISEKDKTVLFIAAWFHDTGHLFVEPAMHEVKSIEIMKTFMRSQSVSENDDLVSAVEKCILATRLPANPKSLPDQIICDADTYHIGTAEFKQTDKQLRKEYLKRKLISPQVNWNKRSLEFLEGHKFHTLYCQGLLEGGKQKNMDRLRRKSIKNEMDSFTIADSDKSDENLSKEEIKQKANLLNKGIQTMLRLTSDNHLALSG